MQFKEILTFADEVIYNRTGKHLSNLQRDILEETLQGHKYAKVAAEHECTVDYVRSVASELWKYLSEEMGEKINRSNIRSTFHRLEISQVSNLAQDVVGIWNLNLCNNQSDPQAKNEQRSPNLPYLDLDDAPKLNTFYGRREELDSLSHWILHQKSRLIAIVGLSGIGKTALTLKLIEEIKDNFDYVIWRNLAYFSNLEALQTNLTQIFPKNQGNDFNTPLHNLIKNLRQYRCLIILDGLQGLFKRRELAGKYKNQYQEYSQFFKLISEINHQSCIIVNSQEAPSEMLTLIEDNEQVRLLIINGLGERGKDILREKAILDQHLWDKLLEVYQSHPLWLKSITALSEQLCDHKIAPCWQPENPLITDTIKTSLEEQIQRLSSLEYEILTLLRQQEKPLTLSEILSQIKQTPTPTVNALKSLINRHLIEKVNKPETRFKIIFIVKKFLNS